MERILVLRGGALGDFILTLPALQLLRTRWPRARLELAGNATAAHLGVLGSVLDAVHSQHEARWSALYSHDALPSDFRHWLSSFDLVCSFWPDPEHELAGHFPLHSGQVFLSAAAKPAVKPAGRHYCEALHPLGLHTDDFQARLTLPQSQPRDPRKIAIHPGSSSQKRNWPVERWASVLGHLIQQGFHCVLIGGEADEFPLKALSTLASSTLQRLPLENLAKELTKCSLYLGHDTGVSHLAAALNTPSLLLFGPSDPELWAPQGKQVNWLKRGESMEAIAVDHVLEKLRPLLAAATNQALTAAGA